MEEPGSGMKVLLIEDDRQFRAHLSASLAGKGVEVLVVDELEKAVEAACKGSFTAVLVGVRKQRREPLDFIAQLKDACPETKAILINHSGEVPVSIEAMKLGAFDEVSVPVDMEALVRLLETAQ